MALPVLHHLHNSVQQRCITDVLPDEDDVDPGFKQGCKNRPYIKFKLYKLQHSNCVPDYALLSDIAS